MPGGLNKASLPPSSVLGPTSIENVSRNAVFFTNLQVFFIFDSSQFFDSSRFLSLKAQPSITLRKLWESSIGELPEVSTEKLLEIIAKDHHFSIRFHPLKGLTSEGLKPCGNHYLIHY